MPTCGKLFARLRLLVSALIIFASAPAPTALAGASDSVTSDWPQWRGPSRDGIAVNSPKLLDSWPKEGPPLLWKSDWIPSDMAGGCASPVVADGKVFLYVNWKHPVGGGAKYKPVTTELLKDAGWLPDVPEDLAKKLEEAWTSDKRPKGASFLFWYAIDAPSDADISAYIEKAPDLKKYVEDFLAKLTPDEVKKYGDFIRRRLCIPYKGVSAGFTWEELTKLTKLTGTEVETYKEYCNRRLFPRNPFDGHAFINGDYGWNTWIRASKMTDTVVCLDAATGKTLWKKDFDEDWTVAFKSRRGMGQGAFGEIGASATPAISKGKCYAAGAMGLYCLSAKDGSLLWQVKSEPAHASPLVANGIVYHLGSAYNADNGQLLWKSPVWKTSWGGWASSKYTSPVLWSSGGKAFIVTSDGSGAWCCLKMETGELAWKLEGRPCEWSSPIVSGDVLTMLMGSPMEMRAYRLTPEKAELFWKSTGKIGWGTHVVFNGSLYMLTNTHEFGPVSFSCLNMKTGETQWSSPQYKQPQGIEGNTSNAIVADGKILNVIGSPHGYGSPFVIEMLKIPGPGEQHVRLGYFDPKISPMTSPALVDGRLFLRLQSCLACYDLRVR